MAQSRRRGSSAYCPASLPSIREGAPSCRPEFRRLFFLCPRQSDRIPAVIQGGGFRKDRYSGGNVGNNGSPIHSNHRVPFFESFEIFCERIPFRAEKAQSVTPYCKL